MDMAVASPQARILVIEDDPVVRFNIVCYLEDSGFAVAEADSADAGIAAVRATPPDLVLCDLRMPGMDGLELLQILNHDQPELPLIVVSGTGVLGDAVDALHNGAWDFVAKPIQDMAVLEHAIASALEKARLIRENRRFQDELEHANRQLRANLAQFEQDAAAGRNLQLQLMPPREQRLGAHRFSRCLLPSLYLSGDFIDCFPLGEQRIGFYLADVSGHGLSSAFVTVLLKGLVDRYRERFQRDGDMTILDPARTLARLDADLSAQHVDKYLTIFYGVLELAEERLSYCNGGHFPSPLLFDGGAARFVDGRSPPVGLFPNAEYASATLALPPAYRLLLFSDGVLDALADAPDLTAKRARLVRAAAASAPTAEGLLATLGLTADATYPDDISLLVVEREANR